MTNHDSPTALAMHSSLIPSMRTRSSSNLAYRSRPSKECRSCAYSSISFSSHLSKSISCWERRAWRSSKIWSKLKKCQQLAVKARILAR
jgi:hypothetical protein